MAQKSNCNCNQMQDIGQLNKIIVVQWILAITVVITKAMQDLLEFLEK